MDKSLIIIGAGVAGLAAGCYAQMNGYRSQILDLHTIPGGLCTWWRRGDHFPLPQPMTLGNLEQERLVLKHYCFDPTMAPPGKSVLSMWCEADYDHWKRLRGAGAVQGGQGAGAGASDRRPGHAGDTSTEPYPAGLV